MLIQPRGVSGWWSYARRNCWLSWRQSILTSFADFSVNGVCLDWLKRETNRHWPTLFWKKNEPKGPPIANIGRRSSVSWNNCVWPAESPPEIGVELQHQIDREPIVDLCFRFGYKKAKAVYLLKKEAQRPFRSPDGRSIGFLVPVSSRASTPLADDCGSSPIH